MGNWTIWVTLLGQLIEAIAKVEGEPLEDVRRRLLADPRVDPKATDDAAKEIEDSLPPTPPTPVPRDG
jgi:hypothetical protein